MKKIKNYGGLHGLIGLVVLIALLFAGCQKAPDDLPENIDEILKEWSVTISAPTNLVYVGDSIALKAVLNSQTIQADSTKIQFNWIISGPDNIALTGNSVKFLTLKAGDYTIKLEAVNAKGETKNAQIKLTVNRRGVIISLGQKGGEYLLGNDLQFDSLEINFRITAAPGDSLGRFSLIFGDESVLDTVVNATQTIIQHEYSDYGSYEVIFVNSEVIVKTFTINEPGTVPVNDTTGDTTIVDGDTIIVTYDVNIDEYNDLIVKTTYPNALFLKVDSANKKFYLLFSVAATERTIGPETPIILKGNWEGKNYSDWATYSLGTAKTMVVTTKKGKYIQLEIKNYVYNFRYRGNIIVNTSDYVNAQNAAPFYSVDLTIGDTGSFGLIIKHDNKGHVPE